MYGTPPNASPQRSPRRQHLQAADGRLAQLALWLFMYGTTSTIMLGSKDGNLAKFVLYKLNVSVVVLALMAIGLRFIWRYIPGRARLLPTLTLSSALIGLAYYPLISGLPGSIWLPAGIGWMLIVAAILLFPLATLFAVTAMEERH